MLILLTITGLGREFASLAVGANTGAPFRLGVRVHRQGDVLAAAGPALSV